LIRQQPTGLTGRVDRSDRSMRSPSVIRLFCRFSSIKRIPCGISPSHSINIKGHGRLGYPIDQIYNTFIFLSFLFALAFPIYYLLFLLHLYVDWGRSRWPADSRTTLRAPAPTGPSRATFVGFAAGLPGDNRSDRYTRPVWPVWATALRYAVARCAF